MSPAGPEHRFVSRPFRRELCRFWAEHLSLVEDVDVKGWVATSPDDDRLPDICVYLKGDDSQRLVPDRAPAMVFEFVSQGHADKKRDYIEKRNEYHAIGVKEYVIVDRFKRAVLVLRWQPDGYTEHALTEHDFYSTPPLPELVIPLSEAFAQGTA
jgi:Uma2 family endonuclease